MAEGTGMIPTILITGFLGAGKTTLLNRLIAYYRSERTALLINEFGSVGIDGQRLKPGEYHKIELNKGSLFCICVRTDFIEAVKNIAHKIKPDLFLIEATGLADTTEMENMLSLPVLHESIYLQTCICIVDAENFIKVKKYAKAPVSQVQSADLVIINKQDLVSTDQLKMVKQAVRQISANAPIHITQFADIPLEVLNHIQRPEVSSPEKPGSGRPDPMVSLTLEKKGDFSDKSWQQFKQLVAPHIERLKGFISLQGQPYYVDATLDQWSWENVGQAEASLNRLVLIGRQLDEEKIEQLFEDSIAADCE